MPPCERGSWTKAATSYLLVCALSSIGQVSAPSRKRAIATRRKACSIERVLEGAVGPVCADHGSGRREPAPARSKGEKTMKEDRKSRPEAVARTGRKCRREATLWKTVCLTEQPNSEDHRWEGGRGHLRGGGDPVTAAADRTAMANPGAIHRLSHSEAAKFQELALFFDEGERFASHIVFDTVAAMKGFVVRPAQGNQMVILFASEIAIDRVVKRHLLRCAASRADLAVECEERPFAMRPFFALDVLVIREKLRRMMFALFLFGLWPPNF